MRTVATEQKSPALLAEALHFRTDSLNSGFALLALVAAALFPEVSGLCDRVGAIAIALCMTGMGLFGAKKNLNQLLDRTPESELFDLVQHAAMHVEGVLGTEKIRIMHYGPDAHVDIDIEVDPHLSVEVAHTISQHVRLSIQNAWPQVQDVTVHIEPYYKDDH
jgi:cation diffusion facilitator family transporter